MNLHENTDFGRKVFFLNPPYDFKSIIMPVLSDMEYELYTIEDYKQAKNILRMFPDSICFVYVDVVMPIDHWFNFIMSFDHDPILSTIFLGVMSDRAGKTDREHFLLNAVIPAGFISLTTTKEDIVDILHGILEINGAKGQRKYVRADCKSDKLVSAQCIIEDTTCFLGINNISSVGLSCSAPPAMAGLFALNLLIHDFTLHLRNKTVKCNAVVINSSVTETEAKIILLFTKGMPHAAKTSVKEYVRFFLQKKADALAASGEPDTADYSKKQKSELSSSMDDAFLIAVDDNEVAPVLYADDLQS